MDDMIINRSMGLDPASRRNWQLLPTDSDGTHDLGRGQTSPPPMALCSTRASPRYAPRVTRWAYSRVPSNLGGGTRARAWIGALYALCVLQSVHTGTYPSANQLGFRNLNDGRTHHQVGAVMRVGVWHRASPALSRLGRRTACRGGGGPVTNKYIHKYVLDSHK